MKETRMIKEISFSARVDIEDTINQRETTNGLRT